MCPVTYGGGGAKVNFPHRTLNKIQKFLAAFPMALIRFFFNFYLKTLIVIVCWQIFGIDYKKINKKKSNHRFFQKEEKKLKLKKNNHIFEIFVPKNIIYHNKFKSLPKVKEF